LIGSRYSCTEPSLKTGELPSPPIMNWKPPPKAAGSSRLKATERPEKRSCDRARDEQR
jgi:hypothetical protein